MGGTAEGRLGREERGVSDLTAAYAVLFTQCDVIYAIIKRTHLKYLMTVAPVLTWHHVSTGCREGSDPCKLHSSRN